MPAYIVKSTGTRTTGESTITGNDLVDFADSNCYALIKTCLAQSNANGNVITLDDEAHVVTTIPAGADWKYSQTMSSRSGNPELCSVTTANTTGHLFDMALGGAPGGDWVFNNIQLTRSTTQTDASSLLYTAGTILQDISFNGCILGDFTLDNAIAGSQLNGCILSTLSHTRTVAFDECTFRNISASWTNAGYGALLRISGNADCTMTNCSWDNIQRNITLNDVTGAVYIDNTGSTTTITDSSFTDITMSGNDTAMSMKPFINSSAVNAQNLSGLTLTRVVKQQAQYTSGIFSFIKGAFDIRDITAIDCSNLGTSIDYIGDGGVFYQDGVSAVGKFRNINAYGCKARSGVAIFSSNGANLECENITADNCQADIGIIYSGYDGDAVINGALITNTTPFTPTQSRHGLGIFARINPAAATDKTVEINNVTLLNNVNDATYVDGIEIINDHATAVMTNVINNVICRNGGETGLEIRSNGTGTITTTMNNCNVEGGATSTSGTINNNLTSVDPLLDANGVPTANSPMVGAGSRWWTGANPVGANGEPFSDFDTDIGAIQSTHGKFHPVNL